MSQSSIEWTDVTWNPVTGCTKVSEGCANCYAERFSHRLKSMLDEGNQYKDVTDTHGRWSGEVTLVEDALDKPYSWRKPRRVFVNSMSDLFHRDVPDSFIRKVFTVMDECDSHIYQLLTKRPRRVAKLNNDLIWSSNIWCGASVESRDYLHRLEPLRRIDAHVKFLSLEPLLGPLNGLNLEGIDWVIVGGESGHNARPVKKEWIEEILVQCRQQDVSFFFKQWGSNAPEEIQEQEIDREFLGQEWNEFPVPLKEVYS